MSLDFKLDRILRFHSAAIERIAICTDGCTAISGDDAGIAYVWDLRSGFILQEVRCPINGAITAIIWIDSEAFVSGCADGTVRLYKRDSKLVYSVVSKAITPGPIEDLAYDGRETLASVGGGLLLLWRISEEGGLVELFRTEKKNSTAKNVAFCDDGTGIVVFFLETREIRCFDVDHLVLRWSRHISTRIGHATLCRKNEVLLVSNLRDGVDQYRFPSLERVKSFSHPISINVPLQVVLADDNQVVVCGGDRGFVRVYGQHSGRLIQTLQHPDSKEVQVVSIYESQFETVIITGASGGGKHDIRVWISRRRTGLASSTTYTQPLKIAMLYALFSIVFLLLPFVVRNRGHLRFIERDSGTSSVLFAERDDSCCGVSQLSIPDEPLLKYPAVGMTIPNAGGSTFSGSTFSRALRLMAEEEINETTANSVFEQGMVCDELLVGLLWNL
ncbi:WD40 repeat-like protein [Schizopora paradoxa]|uniref:WD40 repeat-like protein n=1 Tax=Schizopora paradoxa TaxID=27342 RepID=A0A0H2QY34_9AGAM|nr:WD40 repeat-like protein [Schizopora paradoxa]